MSEKGHSVCVSRTLLTAPLPAASTETLSSFSHSSPVALHHSHPPTFLAPARSLPEADLIASLICLKIVQTLSHHHYRKQSKLAQTNLPIPPSVLPLCFVLLPGLTPALSPIAVSSAFIHSCLGRATSPSSTQTDPVLTLGLCSHEKLLGGRYPSLWDPTQILHLHTSDDLHSLPLLLRNSAQHDSVLLSSSLVRAVAAACLCSYWAAGTPPGCLSYPARI